MDIMSFITEKALILIPVLYIIGMMLKNTSKIQDWSIPWILLIVGIGSSIGLLGFNMEAIIQGVLVTGTTVYTNQLFKQSTIKKKEQDEKS
ncbi:putative phage holin [Clostridium argentinense CDC 2741]|uniref:Putative phage holin n=1 Tax=Clostridium argentinense CDC 2741 TaxID=1418104 RepID=A0A0C1R9H0_9CLOT|nr:phage holin family protein [Clostridium argentinense]ARC85547.1 holin [Clostridium argentinense]KIE47086.1 putative phage holin [Clostridium argentinense CDC 2741]NFF40061.1 holin [Clostridium argentinense]NFP50239.1 holin [Clostridium argentinense]NFP71880.1 holin [Clostridium argentinense]